MSWPKKGMNLHLFVRHYDLEHLSLTHDLRTQIALQRTSDELLFRVCCLSIEWCSRKHKRDPDDLRLLQWTGNSARGFVKAHVLNSSTRAKLQQRVLLMWGCQRMFKPRQSSLTPVPGGQPVICLPYNRSTILKPSHCLIRGETGR